MGLQARIFFTYNVSTVGREEIGFKECKEYETWNYMFSTKQSDRYL